MDILSFLRGGALGPYQSAGPDEVKIHCPYPHRHTGGMDKNPSCFLNLNKLVFYCHSCGAGGHINKILKSVGEEYANIEPKVSNHFEVIEEIFLDPVILRCWDYLPFQWVSKFNRRVLEEHMIGFDYVNQRITIPIFDKEGKLVAISGRTIHSKEYCKEHNIARYKMYKYELCDYLPIGYKPKKGNYLWRHHLVKNFDEIIIVEGFKAAMWCVMAGMSNVVATMGLAFTQKQVLHLLNMDCRKYIILYDGGLEAVNSAKKLGITLKSEGCYTQVIELPDDKQPDDFSLYELKKLIYP